MSILEHVVSGTRQAIPYCLDGHTYTAIELHVTAMEIMALEAMGVEI